MEINRSVKCSLKFLTHSKNQELQTIKLEYTMVVNKYINLFWLCNIKKFQLKKEVLNEVVTWLSQRMKQQAAREAIDMIASAVQVAKERKKSPLMPVHHGKRMQLSSAICSLVKVKTTTEFDMWLQFRSVGSAIKLDIPIKLHRQFHKWNIKGKLLGSFVITDTYVQFSFGIETGTKKEITNCLGIDTGINCLASLSNGEQIGIEIKQLIENIKRKRYGNKGHKRAIVTLQSYISRTAKLIAKSDVSLIVVENLKNITKNTKIRGRLNKSMRSSISKWNVGYWFDRLEQKCEENRISFRRVSPYYTSQTCNICGSVDRKNRQNEKFKCLECNHQANADINAAKNILDRFFTGKYGSGFKTETMLLNIIV